MHSTMSSPVYFCIKKKNIYKHNYIYFSKKNRLSWAMAIRKIVACANGTEWKPDYRLLWSKSFSHSPFFFSFPQSHCASLACIKVIHWINTSFSVWKLFTMFIHYYYFFFLCQLMFNVKKRVFGKENIQTVVICEYY